MEQKTLVEFGGRVNQMIFDMNQEQRKCYLSLLAIVGDLSLDNLLERGFNYIWKMVYDETMDGFMMELSGLPFKICISDNNVGKELRYYYVQDTDKGRRISDMFSLNSWEKIDKWLTQTDIIFPDLKLVK